MRKFTQPEGYNFEAVATVGEYVIYKYKSHGDTYEYTYWYSNEPSGYVSSLKTLEQAEADIMLNMYKCRRYHRIMVSATDTGMICVLKEVPYELPIVCMYTNYSNGFRIEEYSYSDKHLDEDVADALMMYFEE